MFPSSPKSSTAQHLEDDRRISYVGCPMSVRRRPEYIERLDLERDRDQVLADPERFLQELALFLRARFDQQLY